MACRSVGERANRDKVILQTCRHVNLADPGYCSLATLDRERKGQTERQILPMI